MTIALSRNGQARYVSTMSEMNESGGKVVRRERWTSLWGVALVSLVAQLALCQFFTFGQKVPVTIDINPSNLWTLAYHFPPTGSFQVLNWLGRPFLPQPLNPFSFAAGHFSPWLFFTFYAPALATVSLVTMAVFLRELECSRPAALFGGVIYAWQGDLLSFIYPAHYGYITTWPFFAIGAWGAVRAQRTGHWAYAVMSGVCCGLMVELEADRGGIASLLIAGLYLAPVVGRRLKQAAAGAGPAMVRHLALCTGVALLVALASLLGLFQTNISGVKLGGAAGHEETYKLVTQFSLGPAETLTYLVPGFFGWHVDHANGPYWGWIGETIDWPKGANSSRDLNLAISTTGTAASVVALIGIGLLLPGRLFGASRLTERQQFYGRALLVMGAVALVLSWGWHTPLYRLAFLFPLMDKWRDPLKWLEMTNFALIVVVAFGAEHLMVSLDPQLPEAKVIKQRLAWFTMGMLVLIGLGFLASYPLAIALAATLQPEGYEPHAIANIMATLHTSLFVALAVMALLCVLIRLLWRPERLRELSLVNPWLNSVWHRMLEPERLPLTLALGLALLGVAQLGWVATQFVAPADLRLLTESNPLLEELRSEGNTVRVSAAPEDPLLNMFILNQFNIYRISCLDISAASRVPDDINAFFGTLEEDRARMWFLAGVKDVVVPQRYLAQMRTVPAIASNVERAEGYTLEETGSPDLPSHAMVTLRDYLAKATLVPEAEIIPTSEAMLKRLKDPSWNPRGSILLSSPAPGLPSAGAKGDAAKPDDVELQNYGPTEIDVAVQSARGGYLLINDQFDSDWQALVNGQEAPLLRADFIMRAVQVPPGASRITMRYEARYHVAGLSLPVVWVNNFSDGVMLLAWIVAGWALWRRGGQS